MPATKKRQQITLDDMPAGSIADIQGRQFPQFKGLIQVAHQHGIESIDSDLVMFESGKAVVKVTVAGERGTYSAHGCACPDDVPKGAASEVIRRGETRGFSRALRLYLGIGEAAADELAPEPGHNAAQSRSNSKPPQHTGNRSNGQPAPTQGRSGGLWAVSPCPACGSRVYDNRGNDGPTLFRCSNGEACPGGKGRYGWAEFKNPNWDDEQQAKAQADNNDAAGSTSSNQAPPPDYDVPPPHDDSDIPF